MSLFNDNTTVGGSCASVRVRARVWFRRTAAPRTRGQEWMTTAFVEARPTVGGNRWA